MPASYAPRGEDGPADRDREDAAAGSLEARVAAARRGADTVLLEGVHALKHAVRFGADIHAVATPEPVQLRRLLAELAPDVVLPVEVQELGAER
jgi:hypothetical protein